jgi:hypothetical protein
VPFVIEEIRKKIKELGVGEADAVGDLCYIIYVEMMRRWNESPRWTTIHYLKKEFVMDRAGSEFLKKVEQDLITAGKINNCTCDESKKFDLLDLFTASDLAFDVFFYRHTIPYEDKKCSENGDILGV